jgi:hypothetical protein
MRGIPDGADTLLHFYRLVQIDHLIREGIFYSQWAPDFVYGFGYPIFNYYAPLSYYLATAFEIVGLNLAAAFMATFLFALVCSSIFTYLWVRGLFGDAAGLVAAALYTLSPYLMIDAVNRGALAELLALALLPLILWAFRRFLNSGKWSYGLTGLLSYALLVLTHNITALIFTPVLIGYLLMVSTVRRFQSKDAGERIANRGVIALGFVILGLGLSAFFWIPALLERDLVQITQLYGPSDFNVSSNFLSVGELLSLPFSTDLNLLNRHVPLSLSLIALGLGLAGAITLGRYRERPGQKGHIIFSGLIFLAAVFMTLAVSSPIWGIVPFLEFVQFPWRMLGLASLFLAMLAGAGVNSLLEMSADNKRLSVAIPAILIGAAALAILPWQFTNSYEPEPEATIEASIEFEQETGFLGTTSTGEYLPLAVQELPSPESQGSAASRDKLKASSLPPGAQVVSAIYDPLAYDLTIDTPTDFTVEFNTFFFEGWQAELDGRQVKAIATVPHGRIGIEVPAGRHQLQLKFGATTIRNLATAGTLVSALVVVVAVVLLRRVKSEDDSPDRPLQRSMARSSLVLISLVILTIAIVKLTYLDRVENTLRRTRLTEGAVATTDHPTTANFDNQLFLLGIDRPDQALSGEQVEIALYWRAGDEVDSDYSVSAVLVGENDALLGQSDVQHPGIRPTSRWKVSDYAQDRHTINLPAGTPPGTYRLQVSVYEYGKPANRLNVLDESGAPAGQVLDVATIAVVPPGRNTRTDALDADRAVDLALTDEISLVGYSIPGNDVAAGEAVFVRMYWRADGEAAEDWKFSLSLTGDGQQIPLIETDLVEDYPTSEWRGGDIWRAVHPILIPAMVETGDYSLILILDGGGSVPLGNVNIVAPEHVMDVPDTVSGVDIKFGELAKLSGYELESRVSPGDQLAVALVWQSLGETRTGYKSFVHLLDAQGQFVAGSDMVPGNWERPTTGWIAGEYVTDRHNLLLPPDLPVGSYRLIVGLYDSERLQRLQSEDGKDAWLLPQAIEVFKG